MAVVMVAATMVVVIMVEMVETMAVVITVVETTAVEMVETITKSLRFSRRWECTIGILRHVITNYLLTTRVFLFIDYQGHRYMGAMDFDDSKFCNEIFSVLHSHVGYSLTQIGDLDLPQTL